MMEPACFLCHNHRAVNLRAFGQNQLVIGGKTNLICNWSKQVQINNPLP